LAVDLPLWRMMEWVTLGMMTCPIWKKIISCSKQPTRQWRYNGLSATLVLLLEL
jgi:hypothetical protein